MKLFWAAALLLVGAAHSEPFRVIPIELDLYKKLPARVSKFEDTSRNVLVFSVEEEFRRVYKIGDVLLKGKMIVPDSDSLVQRTVMYEFEPNSYANRVQVNSVYYEGGVERGEMLELEKSPSGDEFVPIVRQPVTLDIRPYARRPHVVAVDTNMASTVFVVRRDQRHKYVIGEVRYGPILISPYDKGDFFKMVTAVYVPGLEPLLRLGKFDSAGNKHFIDYRLDLAQGTCTEIDRFTTSLVAGTNF